MTNEIVPIIDPDAGPVFRATYTQGFNDGVTAAQNAHAICTGRSRTFARYRAVCVDHGQNADEFEHGIMVSSRYSAEHELSEMMHEASPPFDDGWIEVCWITNWERLPATDTDSPAPGQEDGS